MSSKIISSSHFSPDIQEFIRLLHKHKVRYVIDGVSFEDVWYTKEMVTLAFPENELPIYFIGLEKLIENKAASGRAKDLEDLAYLRHASKSKR